MTYSYRHHQWCFVQFRLCIQLVALKSAAANMPPVFSSVQKSPVFW
ncbi:hypothetical protein VIBHAR_05098 [Vibrio campbellii ATCC BAA-1116]|uniref:Uncharacterized protein n=1 Tax=Vibrio campbellii (strain ATCC BAA-1116) TaxID=2902295 RepID=A7N338_VIBC1|nr:hypothetical protein VIBHAR_05098 [Vibrio campbellii ATCC BAA-1116]